MKQLGLNLEAIESIPLYRPRSLVHAAKIGSMAKGQTGIHIAIHWLHETRGAVLTVTPEWISKNKPESGGYVLIYDEGDTLVYMPRQAFRDQYERVAVVPAEIPSANTAMGVCGNNGETPTPDQGPFTLRPGPETPTASQIKQVVDFLRLNGLRLAH